MAFENEMLQRVATLENEVKHLSTSINALVLELKSQPCEIHGHNIATMKEQISALSKRPTAGQEIDRTMKIVVGVLTILTLFNTIIVAAVSWSKI